MNAGRYTVDTRAEEPVKTIGLPVGGLLLWVN